jgi:hypothetical protein
MTFTQKLFRISPKLMISFAQRIVWQDGFGDLAICVLTGMQSRGKFRRLTRCLRTLFGKKIGPLL